MTRKAYQVTVRCMWNGADTTKRLWLADGNRASADFHINATIRMKRYVPAREREHLRLVSCVLDADQTRPVSP